MGNLTYNLFAVAQKTKEPTINENVTKLTDDNRQQYHLLLYDSFTFCDTEIIFNKKGGRKDWVYLYDMKYTFKEKNSW